MNSIFVSSSFKDMQYERDSIRNLALPQINDYLRTNYGQETTIIDLRWGIDTATEDEYESMSKILRTCLYEIDNCKPFMVVLLGDRYGTIIDKTQINKCISDLSEYEYNSDSIGVTELEIRYAMKLVAQEKMNVFFYFRSMDYSNVNTEDKTTIYFDSEAPDEKQAKLEILKAEIRLKFPSHCRSYRASWDNKNSQLCGVDKLVEYIFKDITTCITDELGPPQASPLYIDEAFEKSRRTSFVGRADEISQIEQFATSSKYDIAILRGSVGVGKSSLLANVPILLKNKDREFVSIFCGQGTSSDTSLDIMRKIVYRIRNLLECTESEDNTLWRADRWHQEMDKLIAQYLKKKQKKLIILIDAIDQMIQNSQTQKMYYLPYTHGGKVKILLSAVTEYKIEEFLPPLEHMTLIRMKEPTKTDINHVVDEVWLKYGKPCISDEIKEELIQKSLSHNYLYVNLLLTRLTYMGMDIFADKNNNNQHITDSIKKVIFSFPNTLEGAAEELLTVLGKLINESLASEVFSFLRLSENGFRLTDLQTLCEKVYNASDFSCIKMLLGCFIFERGDHRYDFTHKIFRQAIDTPLNTSLCYRYFQYATSLPVDDALAVQFIIHSTIISAKYDELYDILERWSGNTKALNAAGKQLARIIQTAETVVSNLVLALPIDGKRWTFIAFVTSSLLPYIPASGISKKLVDSLSDKIFSSYLLEQLDDQRLEILSNFEEMRFKLHYDYSGEDYCETNRYFSCIVEHAKRHSTPENNLKVANFRLRYEKYWNPFSEKYDFHTDKDMMSWRFDFIYEEILDQYKNSCSINSLLLCANAYVEKASFEYANVITHTNVLAEKNITKTLRLLNKAKILYMINPLRRKEDHLIKIAECYMFIGNIYMRATETETLYKKAGLYLEKARKLLVLSRTVYGDERILRCLNNILYKEGEIITRGDHLNCRLVKKIDSTVSELLRYVEKSLYIFTQSQELCGQYAQLCATKANVISYSVPTILHISDAEAYPWSSVYTREESCCLHQTLTELDYWCDKLVFISKYLFSVNPTEGNIERLISASKSQIDIFNMYGYRSLETIEKAKYDPLYLQKPSIDDLSAEKDMSYQLKRKIPLFLNLCDALSHHNIFNKNKAKGLYLIVVYKIYCTYNITEFDDILSIYRFQLSKVEHTLMDYINQALLDDNSFSYYLLSSHLGEFDFDKLLFYKNSNDVNETRLKCKMAFKEKTVFHTPYENLYYEWCWI